MSKFYELKKGAEEAQQRKARDENDAITMATNYFLKSGIDYKGQFQCCYDAKGLGGEVKVSVDPAAFFIPFLHTELTFSAETSGSKERMIVTQRGPSEIGIYTVSMPIMINCLIGWDVTATVKVGLEVSVGLSFSLSPGTNPHDSVNSTKKSYQQKEFDNFECEFESAGLSLEAEAKTGFQASASYSYEHFFAIDCAPVSFLPDDKAHVRYVLGQVWHTGSYKSALKLEVEEFLNKYDKLWRNEGERPARYQVDKIINLRDSSQRFCELLDRIITNPLLNKKLHPEFSCRAMFKISSRRIIKLAIAYKDALSVWTHKDNQPSISTYLAISSHKGEGDAGLFAKAGVSANATLVNAELGLELKGPTVSGSYKHANIRYQAVYPATFETSVDKEIKVNETKVVMTQETQIVYKTFDLTAFAATVNAQAGAIGLGEIEAEAGVSVSTSDGFSAKAGMKARKGILRGGGGVEKEKEKSKGGGHFFSNLNRLTYETTTIFWSDDNYTAALPGTGYSVGGSFLIKNLISVWKDIHKNRNHMEKLSKSTQSYMHNIAQSLKITDRDVSNFFVQLTEDDIDFYFKNTMEELECEALLLEASFKVRHLDLDIKPLTWIDGDRSDVPLDPTATKRILDLPFGEKKQLESIKLRYRIQDTHDYSTNLFKLGVKGTGIGGGITLKKIHKAGSEGIVDLLSVWIGGKVVADSQESAEMYERAVPPVVLFCQ